MILSSCDTAPEFSLPDQHGSVVRLAEVLDRSVLVLAFLPFAFSPVCGDEVRDLDRWRTRLQADGAGVEVLAVTADAKYTLAAWAQERAVSLPLCSDFWPHGATASDYGVFDPVHGVAERGVFVIAGDGTIVSSRRVGRTETRDFAREISAATAAWEKG